MVAWARLSLVVVELLAVAGCDRAAKQAHGCPEGQRSDEDRTRRVRTLLASTPAGQRLLQRVRQPLRICYADGIATAITTTGALALDSAEGDAESAARLGHLLQHAVEGAPLTRGLDRPCPVLVEDAIRAEARAHALELELRRALGVTRPRRPLPFEAAYWAAPAASRLEQVRAYLWSHPSGGDGLPGLVDAYRQRCAELRRRPPGTPR
jgi:hypothetical protein